MINWILAGALAAVLAAELTDAWALHHLTQRCRRIQPRSKAEVRLVHWYAEGFDHSRAICGWLQVACLLLTGLSVVFSAHPLIIMASLALTVVAHGERQFSDSLRRRFGRAERRRMAAAR